MAHATQFEHSIEAHDSYDLGGHPGEHVILHEEVPESVATNWRDDKYHDHGGFDLRPEADDEHGSEHISKSSKDTKKDETEHANLKAHQDGVEHIHRESFYPKGGYGPKSNQSH